MTFDVRMAPGGGPPALHRHDAFEAYRVDGGELAFYVADEGGRVQRTVVGAGATVPIPGGPEHTIRNESDGDAHTFVAFAPGAEMEGFARAAAAEHDLDRLMAIAAEHGIEITRPLPVPAERCGWNGAVIPGGAPPCAASRRRARPCAAARRGA